MTVPQNISKAADCLSKDNTYFKLWGLKEGKIKLLIDNSNKKKIVLSLKCIQIDYSASKNLYQVSGEEHTFRKLKEINHIDQKKIIRFNSSQEPKKMDLQQSKQKYE